MHIKATKTILDTGNKLKSTKKPIFQTFYWSHGQLTQRINLQTKMGRPIWRQKFVKLKNSYKKNIMAIPG